MRPAPRSLRREEAARQIRAEAARFGFDVDGVLDDWERLEFLAGIIPDPERPFRLYDRTEVARLAAAALRLARLRRPAWTATLAEDGRVRLEFDPEGRASTWTSAAATAQVWARQAKADAIGSAESDLLSLDLLARSLDVKPRTLRGHRKARRDAAKIARQSAVSEPEPDRSSG